MGNIWPQRVVTGLVSSSLTGEPLISWKDMQHLGVLPEEFSKVMDMQYCATNKAKSDDSENENNPRVKRAMKDKQKSTKKFYKDKQSESVTEETPKKVAPEVRQIASCAANRSWRTYNPERSQTD